MSNSHKDDLGSPFHATNSPLVLRCSRVEITGSAKIRIPFHHDVEGSPDLKLQKLVRESL